MIDAPTLGRQLSGLLIKKHAENGLRVVTEFMPISARFIANKASYQFKHREMDEMLEKLRAALAAKEEKK